MKWYFWNIEKMTLENDNFRKVLYTAKHCQLVLMSLKAWEEIWEEVHTDNDQFFRFESWDWEVHIDDNVYKVKDWSAIIVPAWARHNVINIWKNELKLYTIYSPAHHKDWIVRITKEEAEKNEEDFDGETTE